jgi:hypothetical protein
MKKYATVGVGRRSMVFTEGLSRKYFNSPRRTVMHQSALQCGVAVEMVGYARISHRRYKTITGDSRIYEITCSLGEKD